MQFCLQLVRRSILQRARPRLAVVVVGMSAVGCGALVGPPPQITGEIVRISSELTRSGTQTTVVARFTNASDRDLFLQLCNDVIHVGAEQIVAGRWEFYSGFQCVTTAGAPNPGMVQAAESVEVSRVFGHTVLGTFRLVVRYGEAPLRAAQYQATTGAFDLARK